MSSTFFTDAFLWVAFLDFMELFDLHLSPMHPATWQARLP